MSDPVDARHHVWESLVSMLRVYAHAASLHGDAYESDRQSGICVGQASRLRAEHPI